MSDDQMNSASVQKNGSGENFNQTVLIIDDDEFFCRTASTWLKGENTRVLFAHTGIEGVDLCSQHRVDVVLLDQNLPDIEGKNLCPAILYHNDQTKIIFVTGYPNFENAVEAIRHGAFDYLSKPVKFEELKLAVDKALRAMDLERLEQVQYYINEKKREESHMVGAQGGLAEIDRLIDMAAHTNAHVLITGETGTGKSMAAKAIHYKGVNRAKPFIRINCAALPETLIESELFGYEKGAFSGAVTTKKGIFEMSEGGTLALEEIGILPVGLQSKLLVVLDEKKIIRLGGESFREVKVRLIATTNVDLEKAVGSGDFRRDLFYRLSVLPVHMPPLRERKDDIPELCRHLMEKLAPNREITMPDEEMYRLMRYDWPGNVRELCNVLERSIILNRGETIYPSKMLISNPEQQKTVLHDNNPQIIPSLKDMEKEHILNVLDLLNNNHTRAASALEISRSTLIRKMKEYGLK